MDKGATVGKRYYEVRERLDLQDAFLESYARDANVTQACKTAHVPRNTVYKWITNDTNGFTARYHEARQEAQDALEAEIHRRAVTGYQEPIVYQGKKTGEITRYSDLLLIFLAKAVMPHKYRDNAPAGPTQQVIIQVAGGEPKPLKQLSDDELDIAIHEMKALPEGKDNG